VPLLLILFVMSYRRLGDELPEPGGG
jgi:hypothetical protein